MVRQAKMRRCRLQRRRSMLRNNKDVVDAVKCAARLLLAGDEGEDMQKASVDGLIDIPKPSCLDHNSHKLDVMTIL